MESSSQMASKFFNSTFLSSVPDTIDISALLKYE